MNKKRILIIIFVIVISIVIAGLYQTFATSSTDSTIYDISLGEDNTIMVPANSFKTVYYKISNTNSGTVRYGTVYSGDNIVVKVYDDSDSPASGIINYKENKFVKLYIENNGNVDSVTSIKAILGYENDENLIIPSDVNLVSDVYYSKITNYIKNLFSSNDNVLNNDIVYNFDTKNMLMMDMDENIRYYGANPNNYIYFNCDDYNNQNGDTCELWRIIGVFDDNVKIINPNSIGKYVWNSSSLNNLINIYYYNNLDTSYYDFNNDLIEANFKSNGIGIKNISTRGFISKEDWNLSDVKEDSYMYPDLVYMSEREDKDAIWSGNIGLMNASDYVYATDMKLCSNTINNYKNNDMCLNNNFLNFNNYTGLLNSVSDKANDIWIVNSGVLENYSIDNVDIYPTLYLKSNVNILSGDGTYEDPFQITM